MIPDSVLELARGAEAVTVFTGSGMSAESGLPTFQEAPTGQWAAYDPMTVASPQSWSDDPGLVWAWYQKRRLQVQAAEPNAAHSALAAWAAFAEIRVITQNVDDLHERAGSVDVVHLHGSLLDSRCDSCDTGYHVTAEEPTGPRLAPPDCVCGGLVRPGVVWFEEPLPYERLSLAIGYAQTCDLLLLVGTSGGVYPAASLPQLAKNRDAAVIEINPSETELSDRADVVWRENAGTALPALVDALRRWSTS